MPAYLVIILALAVGALAAGFVAGGRMRWAGAGVLLAAAGPALLQHIGAFSFPVILLSFVICDALCVAGILAGMIDTHPRRLRCRSALNMAASVMVASVFAHGLFAVGAVSAYAYTVIVLVFMAIASALVIGVGIGGRYGAEFRSGPHRVRGWRSARVVSDEGAKPWNR
jgi:hypothetical protein